MKAEEYKTEIIRMISDMNLDFIESVYWFIKGMLSVGKKGDGADE